jgi:ABC-type spermidine/putrescine transport system permease subunit II
MSPLILPTIITGIAMLQYFNRLGFGTTYWGLVLGHVVITTPYVIRLVGASLSAIDPRIELAARNLGAPPLTAFLRTTGRIALPGLAAGAAFAFITSFDNVTISVFLTTPRLVTLPVRIYNLLDQPIYPWLVAICSMIIAITTVLIIVIERRWASSADRSIGLIAVPSHVRDCHSTPILRLLSSKPTRSEPDRAPSCGKPTAVASAGQIVIVFLVVI